jgi:diaminohydroxyphosphoribosylaminopyrimidine deaminase/5-amino-6-(5-phosphoribosylamino)uracil reductase
MLSQQDQVFMAQAIALAKKGLYTTMPNPRVGCVLVREGSVIATGWHQLAGKGHAEVNALAAAETAGLIVQNATAYVTLEPCSHTGKTGPCAEALIKAGISRLVFGMQDPNPQVAGRGLELIKVAGIEVDGPCLEAESQALNPGFIRRMQKARPLVRCKLAMSLDGRTAMASGESKWITSAAARSDVQRLRARSCAIITGIGSILHDDSSLTVRADELDIDDAESAAAVQPLRIVLDSKQRLPLDAKVVQYAPAQTRVVTAQPHLRPELAALGVEELCFPRSCLPESERVDLTKVVEWLAEQQCNEVLVEAGSELSGAFLQAGLIDEVIVYLAPKLMGSKAKPLFDLGLNTMSEQVPLTITDIRAVGDDWRITFKPELN